MSNHRLSGNRFWITLFVIILVAVISISISTEKTSYGKELSYALVVHAGSFGPRGKPTYSEAKEYKKKLSEALKIGEAILKNGGNSLDAVEACIKFLEDSPLFGAGKGAPFNSDGKNELDACIMDGKTLQAGAVTNVTIIKNPITAARRVMTHTKYVLLCASGADRFAKDQGLEIVDPSYFRTDKEWKLYQKMKKESSSVDGPKYGTVGAVALDKNGNLAAGTSTGGLPHKKYGRIGDSPIVGAGTYANNKTCAVSATGIGEFFIRNVAAYDISALMEYSGLSVKKAADKVVNRKLKYQRGWGGVIAIDKHGNIAMPCNCTGMRRGYITSDGKMKVYAQ